MFRTELIRWSRSKNDLTKLIIFGINIKKINKMISAYNGDNIIIKHRNKQHWGSFVLRFPLSTPEIISVLLGFFVCLFVFPAPRLCCTALSLFSHCGVRLSGTIEGSRLWKRHGAQTAHGFSKSRTDWAFYESVWPQPARN